MTTFSVITPTVVRETLSRTCHSLDEQWHGQWQHLVIVDKPESLLTDQQRHRLSQVSHPQREIRFCSQAHRDFGNTCRWNAWDFVRGDYILYLDDDDYYLADALAELQKGIAALPSAPVWGIFPILRYGRLFFNVPPGLCVTCSNQFFHLPRNAGRELRYLKAGYCADGIFIEELRNSFPYACIHSARPLAVVEQSNMGLNVPLDREFFEAAFADYIGHYSIETEAISLPASYYLWELLSTINPLRILDLGSGWSSFVFKLYKKIAVPDLVVCSMDESEHWLGITRRFLAKHNLDIADLQLWPPAGGPPYDIVFYDLGRPWDRHAHLNQVLESTCGVLACNDMHYGNYRAQLEVFAAARGLSLTLVPESTDRFGRFLGLIDRQRPAVPPPKDELSIVHVSDPAAQVGKDACETRYHNAGNSEGT